MLVVTVKILHNTVPLECERITIERADQLTLWSADSTVHFPTKAVVSIQAVTTKARKD